VHTGASVFYKRPSAVLRLYHAASAGAENTFSAFAVVAFDAMFAGWKQDRLEEFSGKSASRMSSFHVSTKF